jgi:hypothetical protein
MSTGGKSLLVVLAVRNDACQYRVNHADAAIRMFGDSVYPVVFRQGASAACVPHHPFTSVASALYFFIESKPDIAAKGNTMAPNPGSRPDARVDEQ